MKATAKKIKELSKEGYSDLTLSELDLVKFFKRHCTEFPILIGDKKMHIHINNNVKNLILEKEVSSEIKLKL